MTDAIDPDPDFAKVRELLSAEPMKVEKQKRTVSARISQSFSPKEVDSLYEILTHLSRGGDARVIARHESFGMLLRKARAMKARSELMRKR